MVGCYNEMSSRRICCFPAVDAYAFGLVRACLHRVRTQTRNESINGLIGGLTSHGRGHRMYVIVHVLASEITPATSIFNYCED